MSSYPTFGALYWMERSAAEDIAYAFAIEARTAFELSEEESLAVFKQALRDLAFDYDLHGACLKAAVGDEPEQRMATLRCRTDLDWRGRVALRFADAARESLGVSWFSAYSIYGSARDLLTPACAIPGPGGGYED